jgi:cytochrome c553
MPRLLLNAILGATLAFGAQGALAQAKKAKKPAAEAAQPKEIVGNADDAHKNKTAMCIGCHGIPGYKTAFPDVYHVPMIAGQKPAYITAALKAYREGARPHPSMRGIAASLSDQDIADLAAYYGSEHAAAGEAKAEAKK